MGSKSIKILGDVSPAVLPEIAGWLLYRRVDKKFVNALQYYQKYGEYYGVRYDFAIMQSVDETGFWSFKGDCPASNNNFAGIGCTGGGEKGEAYVSMEQGIHAQIQLLAIRAGVDVPRELVVSPRYRGSLYDVIFDKIDYFSELGGGVHAANPNYWEQISGHANDFCVFSGLNILNDSVPELELVATMESSKQREAVNYLVLNRTDGGEPAVTAYSGEVPLFTRYYRDIEDLFRFAKYFPNANTMLVADTATTIIPKVPDVVPGRTEAGEFDSIEPLPENPVKPLKGKKILLDPGHSEVSPGARGQAPDYPEEEDCVLIQAKLLQAELKRHGAQCDIYNPSRDSLSGIGSRAKGYDMFLSLHLNAFDKDDEDEYSCAMVHSKHGRTEDYKLASKIAVRVAHKLGNPLFRPQTEYPGVYPARLGVLTAAIKSGCPVCTLVESFFIDAYGNQSEVLIRAEKAAEGIAEGVLSYYGYESSGVQIAPMRSREIKTFRRGANVQLSKHFHLREWECRCGCSTTKVDMRQVRRMQQFRDWLGVPVNITSAYRCAQHNRRVGGRPASLHLVGTATDWYIRGKSGYEMHRLATRFGFDGVGRYNSFCHTDMRGYKARW